MPTRCRRSMSAPESSEQNPVHATVRSWQRRKFPACFFAVQERGRDQQATNDADDDRDVEAGPQGWKRMPDGGAGGGRDETTIVSDKRIMPRFRPAPQYTARHAPSAVE